MIGRTLVKIVIDPKACPPGKLVVGGAFVYSNVKTDEQLGQMLRTKVVRVHDEDAAEALREWVRESGDHELADGP